MNILNQIVLDSLVTLIKNGVTKRDITDDTIMLYFPESVEDEIKNQLADDIRVLITSATVDELLSGIFEYYKSLKVYDRPESLFDHYFELAQRLALHKD